MRKSNIKQNILSNRLSVATESRGRLLWESLNSTESGAANFPTSNAEVKRKDESYFPEPIPDLSGLGAVAPREEDGTLLLRDHTSNEKLKKQLFGKEYNKFVLSRGSKVARTVPPVSSKSSRQASIKEGKNDSEDEGRSALGRKADRLGPKGDRNEMSTKAMELKSSKRATNYLDEVLQDKASKKKRKRKRM